MIDERFHEGFNMSLQEQIKAVKSQIDDLHYHLHVVDDNDWNYIDNYCEYLSLDSDPDKLVKEIGRCKESVLKRFTECYVYYEADYCEVKIVGRGEPTEYHKEQYRKSLEVALEGSKCKLYDLEVERNESLRGDSRYEMYLELKKEFEGD